MAELHEALKEDSVWGELLAAAIADRREVSLSLNPATKGLTVKLKGLLPGERGFVAERHISVQAMVDDPERNAAVRKILADLRAELTSQAERINGV